MDPFFNERVDNKISRRKKSNPTLPTYPNDEDRAFPINKYIAHEPQISNPHLIRLHSAATIPDLFFLRSKYVVLYFTLLYFRKNLTKRIYG